MHGSPAKAIYKLQQAVCSSRS